LSESQSKASVQGTGAFTYIKITDLLNSYNFIASSYSFWSRLMYGNSLLAIQLLLIKELPHKGHLLILGGGIGQILPSIYNQSPNLKITFLEASSKMIALAKKQIPTGQNITFIHSDSLESMKIECDYVYASFFLDLFSPSHIKAIVKTIENYQTHPVTWFIADFHLGPEVKYKLLRAFQVKLSILFFTIATNHQQNFLPDVFEFFTKSRYKSLITIYLKYGFLRAQVFKS
tara:strand:- start:102 stop:794 length:693 start_codon:yes stop_codon:yes gene_type:complete